MSGTRSEDLRDRYRAWTDLTYHYGIPPSELAQLPKWLRKIYIEELPRLRALDKSEALDTSAFPHMDRAGQRRLLRKLDRSIGTRAEKLTARRAAASGIGVKFVPQRGND